MLELNPYAPPATRTEALPLSAAERVRRQHLQREACANGLSFVFFGIAVALLMAAALVSLSLLSATPGMEGSSLHLAVALVLAVLALRIAFGLRRLDLKVRLWLVPVAVVLLLGIPLGTMAAVWMFHQLLGRKASIIFSDDYRSVISQTGSMSARLSAINLMVIVLLQLFAGGGIFMYTQKLV